MNRLTLRKLTAEVRACNNAYDGPGPIALDSTGAIVPFEHGPADVVTHGEEIPGDGKPVDAVAIARRLLAAWRDAHTRTPRKLR